MKPPLSSDPYDILLAHNNWGNRQILTLSSRLTREQFHRSFPIGPGENGGLHATLTHIISVMFRWSDRISARPVRPSLEAPRPHFPEPTDHRERTVQELLDLSSKAHEALAVLKPRIVADPSEIVHVTFSGKPFQFSAGAAYVHVLTHGHYHRAQCLNMLRLLGVTGISDNLPEIDITDWQHQTECA